MRANVAGLDVCRAGRRNEAEEDEDGKLAQAGRCVRLRPARIENRSQDRDRTEPEQPPSCGARDEQSGDAGHGERHRGRRRDGTRGLQAARSQTNRPDARGRIDTALAVGVIVGVVHADLQTERNQQTPERTQRGRVLGGRRPHDDGRHADAEGTRARAQNPKLQRGGC